MLQGNKVTDGMFCLFVFQKKRTIDDESDFCTEETLNDVLSSKVIIYFDSNVREL